jgi:hypothetical protein
MESALKLLVIPTLGESACLAEAVALGPAWQVVLVGPSARVADLRRAFPACKIVTESGPSCARFGWMLQGRRVGRMKGSRIHGGFMFSNWVAGQSSCSLSMTRILFHFRANKTRTPLPEND